MKHNLFSFLCRGLQMRRNFLTTCTISGTQGKKLQADIALCGRSMVEMLGVLAIIGVLSVGAMSGYSKAMMKYKLNKQAEQLSWLFNIIYQYKGQFVFDKKTSMIPLFTKLNLIDQNMIRADKKETIYDSFDNAIGIGKDIPAFVGIASPFVDDLAGEVDKPFLVLSLKANHGKGPIEMACLDVLIACKGQGRDFLGKEHGEGIASALVMVMGQNRSADDRKIGVGAEHVVRELFHKGEKMADGLFIDDHRHMLAVEDDAVFVVVGIGRILEIEGIATEVERKDADRFPGRVVDPSPIAFVFLAQQAGRIRRRFHL